MVARDVYALLCAFRDDEAVKTLPSYALLQRLFDEQCELGDDDPESGQATGGESTDGGGDAPGDNVSRVKLREPRSIKANTLQSPHDPDTTYGHKGKGYEAQVAETCDDSNPFQLITGTSVNGAHASDQRAVVPMLDQLEASEMAPDELLADTGYGSGANIVEAARRDVDLQAPVQDPNAPAPTEYFARPAADTPERADRSDALPTFGDDGDGPIGLDLFAFDTTCQEIICCPAGHSPCKQHVSGGRLNARFAANKCETCPMAGRCPTRLLTSGDRQLRRAPATIATTLRQVEQQQKPCLASPSVDPKGILKYDNYCDVLK